MPVLTTEEGRTMPYDDAGDWYLFDEFGDRDYSVPPPDAPAEEDEDEDEESGGVNQAESYDFANDHKPTPPKLLLPVLPNRKSRLISIEQEVARNGIGVAE